MGRPSWRQNRSQQGSRSDVQNVPNPGDDNNAKMAQHGPRDPPQEGPQIVQNRPRNPTQERPGAKSPPGPLRDPLLGWILVPGAPSRSPRGPPNRRFGSHFGSPNRCFWSLSRFELPSKIGPHLALFSKADRGAQGVLRRCSAQRAQSAAARLLRAARRAKRCYTKVDQGRSRQ